MRYLGTLLFVVLVLAIMAPIVSADTIIEPNVGFVNEIISGDTTATGARNDSVYVFRRGATYWARNEISNSGWTMVLKAEDGDGPIPVIATWPDADGSIEHRLVTGRADCYLYNLYLDGMGPDLVDTSKLDPLFRMNGQLVRANASGAVFVADGCILNNCGQVTVRSSSGAQKVELTNCIITNAGQLSRDNLGNGRVLDFRDAATDSLIIKNTTIMNGEDRVIRHQDASGKNNFLGYCEMDHVTIANWVGTFGVVQLGDLGEEGFVLTNNLWVNPQCFGEDPDDEWRILEFGYSGEFYQSGKPKMALIRDEPNVSDTLTVVPNFYIENNVIHYQQPVLDYFEFDGVAPAPIMTDRIASMNSAPGEAFVEGAVEFTNPNDIPLDLMYWYHDNPGAITTDSVEMDRRSREFWSDSLDMSYEVANDAFVGTDGLPVGDTNWASVVTTGINDNTKAPATMALNQNYPNPFNPTTSINYTLKKSGKVTLKVFDTLGREVSTLVNSNVAAGSYDVTFDGASLASGVYFYTLKTDNQTLTRKMLLVK